MKRIVIALMGATAVAAGAAAAPLSPEQALARAGKQHGAPYSGIAAKAQRLGQNTQGVSKKPGISDSRGMSAAELRLTFEKSEEGMPSLYVFNRKYGEGYMILSADDSAPAVLGYADSGEIPADESQQPDGLRYWLSTLSEQVAYLRSTAAGGNDTDRQSVSLGSKAGAPGHIEQAPIEPLCSTRWNQDAPYNNRCPLQRQVRCYTGCVATAMAQVMKYHNWPDTGEGERSYQWGTSTLRSDFSKLTFDWDNMLDRYYGSYTDVQSDAVAVLMRACGISVSMNYSTSGSGAQSNLIGTALGSYFKYDKSLSFEQRDFYSLTDWETLIYNSLKEYGPVVYNGQSYQGGHSFVCDGYSADGYFHFNWGWGGMSDGYFLLDALDPASQGIGGSISGTGFDFMQDVIVGIRPDRTGTSEWVPVITVSDFHVETDQTYTLGSDIATTGFILNMGPGVIPENTYIGMLFTPAEGNPYVTAIYNDEVIYNGFGFRNATLPVPEELPDGTYRATLAYRLPGEEWQNVRMPVSAPQYYTAEVRNGIVTLTEAPTPEPEGTITRNTSIVPEEEFTIEGTLTNSSEQPFYGSMLGVLLKDGSIVAQSLETPLDLYAGETRDFKYTSVLTVSRGQHIGDGTYDFCMAYTANGYISSLTDFIPVVIKSSGVDEGVSEEADTEAEYYNLQGIRVEPVPGMMVIRRCGTKTEKIVY